MGALANSEDPDEMPHNVAFHQSLHRLLRQNRSPEKKIQYFIKYQKKKKKKMKYRKILIKCNAYFKKAVFIPPVRSI